MRVTFSLIRPVLVLFRTTNNGVIALFPTVALPDMNYGQCAGYSMDDAAAATTTFDRWDIAYTMHRSRRAKFREYAALAACLPVQLGIRRYIVGTGADTRRLLQRARVAENAR